MTPAENVEKIETLQAASGRVQASVNPTGVPAATRLLSTAIQQEGDQKWTSVFFKSMAFKNRHFDQFRCSVNF